MTCRECADKEDCKKKTAIAFMKCSNVIEIEKKKNNTPKGESQK